MNSICKKEDMKRNLVRFTASMLVCIILISLLCITASAAPSIIFNPGDTGGDDAGNFGIVDMLLLLTVLALAPSILIMMTSFTRIIIILSFVRSAIGTQQSPPNQILIGIALFLSLFIMTPVINTINEEAYKPYKEGLIDQSEFIAIAEVPIKEFMLKQTYTNDLNLFLSISQNGQTVEDIIIESPEDLTQLGLEIIVPSFITSELKRAFNIGFLLFVPFLVIDIVVSSTLMAMGMVMLPPSMIALPFKIMMFVLVDGWGLLFGNIVKGFR